MQQIPGIFWALFKIHKVGSIVASYQIARYSSKWEPLSLPPSFLEFSSIKALRRQCKHEVSESFFQCFWGKIRLAQAASAVGYLHIFTSFYLGVAAYHSSFVFHAHFEMRLRGWSSFFGILNNFFALIYRLVVCGADCWCAFQIHL